MPINFNVKTKIKVNGIEYNSPEEMPPDVRGIYEKAMANREGSTSNTKVNSKITFNGQTYGSLDEMPLDVRRIYESVMAAVDKNGDGIPDSLQSGGGATFEPSAPFIPPQRNAAPVKTNTRAITVALIALMLLMLIGIMLLAQMRH
jgi:hypothetical protein